LGISDYTSNPSYLRGGDQENQSLKPAQANSSPDSILKKPFTKRAGGVAQGIGPKFKPQYGKKKKKRHLLHLFCPKVIKIFFLSTTFPCLKSLLFTFRTLILPLLFFVYGRR
jgi:hypothetical protein